MAAFANDTFPYKLLADDEADNRNGISNGGNPEGNYDAAAGGWQRGNIGAGNNGWTGYDYLHGGQSTVNQLEISSDRLAGGQIDFTAAVLIKYTDPRGMGNKNFRFPPETTDVFDFAYRLPFAALDNSVIRPVNPIQIGNDIFNTTDIQLSVRDWDTRADEAADDDLSDEADVSLIQPNADGIPTVEFDCPILMDGIVILTGQMGNGPPGDLMVYGATISNDRDPGAGTVYGMARVEDNEHILDRSSYHFGVDPQTIEPTATPMPIVTYQAIPIQVGEDPVKVEMVSPTGTLGLPGTGVTFVPFVEGTATQYTWYFGNGAITSTTNTPSPPVILNEPGNHVGSLEVRNADGQADLFPFQFTVLTPQIPIFNQYSLELGNPINPVTLDVDGRPAIVYADSTTDAIRMVRALVDVPTEAGNWSNHSIGIDVDLADAEFGSLLDATVHNNTIAVVNSQAQVAISDSLTPSGMGNWTWHAYDVQTNSGQTPSIISTGDRLAIAYGVRGTGPAYDNDVFLAYSLNADPDATVDWNELLILNRGVSEDTLIKATMILHHPPGYAVYGSEKTTTNRMFHYLYISNTQTPADFSDFGGNTFAEESEAGFGDVIPDMIRYQDRLTVIWGGGQSGDGYHITRASVYTPLTPLQWFTYRLARTGLAYDLSIVEYKDRPLVTITDLVSPDVLEAYPQPILYRALVPQPNDAFSWQPNGIVTNLTAPDLPIDSKYSSTVVWDDNLGVTWMNRDPDELHWAYTSADW